MCIDRARGYPQMRDQSPACLLERGSLISLPQLPSGDSFLSYCPCGPQPDTPQVSPSGIQSPWGGDTDLNDTSNLYSGEPGASLGFSGTKDVSRLFPRFLIIFSLSGPPCSGSSCGGCGALPPPPSPSLLHPPPQQRPLGGRDHPGYFFQLSGMIE